jgi:hypothetical protein
MRRAQANHLGRASRDLRPYSTLASTRIFSSASEYPDGESVVLLEVVSAPSQPCPKPLVNGAALGIRTVHSATHVVGSDCLATPILQNNHDCNLAITAAMTRQRSLGPLYRGVCGAAIRFPSKVVTSHSIDQLCHKAEPAYLAGEKSMPSSAPCCSRPLAVDIAFTGITASRARERMPAEWCYTPSPEMDFGSPVDQPVRPHLRRLAGCWPTRS